MQFPNVFLHICIILVGLTRVVYPEEKFTPMDDVSSCFPKDTTGLKANCTISKLEGTSGVQGSCKQPWVLHISGEFRVLRIICSAHYPLDLYYFGIQPTEGILVDWYKDVSNNSNRHTNSFNIEIKIQSVQETFNLFKKRAETLGLNVPGIQDYSRTGNYVFRGIFNKTRETSMFLYLEDPKAKHSFLRNEKTKIKYEKTSDGFGRLHFPCISSHFQGTVRIERLDSTTPPQFHSSDPRQGFTATLTSSPETYFGKYKCTLTSANTSEVLDTLELSFSAVDTPEFSFGMTQPVPEVDKFKEMIKYETTLDKNRNVDVLALCRVQHWQHPKTFFASIETHNNAYMRLVRQFVLPEFSNRSYSVQIGVETDTLLREYRIPRSTHLRSGVTYCNSGDFTFELIDYGVSLDGVLVKFTYEKEWADFDRRTSNVRTHLEINMERPAEDLQGGRQDGIIYADTELTFICKLNIVVVFKPTIWYTEWKNGTMVEEFIDYDWRGERGQFSYFTKKMPADVVAVYCFASYWYSDFWRNISVPLNLTAGSSPTIKNTETELSMQPGFANSLNCKADGRPVPMLTWKKGNVILSSGFAFRGELIYGIPQVDYNHAGEYICKAENRFGSVEKTFSIEVTSEKPNYGVLVGIPITVFIVTAAAAYIYIKFFRKEKTGLTREEIEEFLQGEKDRVQGKHEYAHEFAWMTPYSREYEIPSSNFQIDQTSILGSGAYGIVLRGIVRGESAAVKTTKKNADKSYLKALLSELKVMIYLGSHENIVEMLGANTKGLDKGIVYIFVKYYSLGNLEHYLKTNRLNYVTSDAYQNITTTSKGESALMPFQGLNSKQFTLQDLYLWSAQIANGMDYLAKKRVIHGDLAIRNILLDDNRQVKITDFGLSRQLYGYASYVKTQQEPLPWRWMALESLTDMTFSTASDIWGYGVTLWEIFSLGEVPYPGMSWTIAFVEELRKGLRMTKPQHATESLYTEIMAPCWDDVADQRPTFEMIKERFNEIMRSSNIKPGWQPYVNFNSLISSETEM